MSVAEIPTARRAYLDAMSDLRLMAEAREIRREIAKNAPYEERGNIAARFANEALRESLAYTLAVCESRGI
jgi:hypothetical protein